MYVVNLQSMEKQINAYLEDEKQKIAKDYERLDKPTKYMCDLEISFTEDLIKLIKDYQERLNNITNIIFEESKEVRNEFSSTNRKIS